MSEPTFQPDTTPPTSNAVDKHCKLCGVDLKAQFVEGKIGVTYVQSRSLNNPEKLIQFLDNYDCGRAFSAAVFGHWRHVTVVQESWTEQSVGELKNLYLMCNECIEKQILGLVPDYVFHYKELMARGKDLWNDETSSPTSSS